MLKRIREENINVVNHRRNHVYYIHQSVTRKGLSLELPVTARPNKSKENKKGRGLWIQSDMVNIKTATLLRDTGYTSILVAEKGVSDLKLANRYSEKCPEV
jgi:hypothetical protein